MGALFEAFLGPRHDYTGHFLAGYGGTLAACMVWLKQLSPDRVAQRGELEVLLVCAACIALGAVAEATIFRLAKFDPVDFFDQSLGAVLAGIISLRYPSAVHRELADFDRGLIVGIAFLGAGGCFAVA